MVRGRLSECFALTRAEAAAERGPGKNGKAVGANGSGRREARGGGVLLMLFLADGVVFTSAE